MPKFDINLKNSVEYLKSMTTQINNYQDDCNTLFRNLNKVDTTWNDPNTIVFIKNIKNDQINFLDHASSMKKYISIINSFFSSLESIVYRELIQTKIVQIKFDSNIINSIINSINNVYNYLDNCTNILNYMTVPDSFKYKPNINEMYEDISVIKNSMFQIKQKCQRINNDIINLFNETKGKMDKVDCKIIDNKKLEYTWSISGISANKVNFDISKKQISIQNLRKLKNNFSDVKNFKLYTSNAKNFVGEFNFSDIKSNENEISFASNIRKDTINNDITLNNMGYYNYQNPNKLNSQDNDITLNGVRDYDQLNLNKINSQNNDIYMNLNEKASVQSTRANYGLNDIVEEIKINNANALNQKINSNFSSVNLKQDNSYESVNTKADLSLSDINLNNSDNSLSGEISNNIIKTNVSGINQSSIDNKLKADTNIGNFIGKE